MAQNAQETVAISRTRVLPEEPGDGNPLAGDGMPVWLVLAGVGGILFFLFIVFVGLMVVLSLLANQNFMDVMFGGAPLANP